MIVINFFAGPGAGKSTTAAALFSIMKKAGKSVELVTEYAKEKVYDNSLDVMKDQLYMLAHQNRRLERLRGKVRVAITDSPLLLSAYYGELYGNHPEIIYPLAFKLFNTYINKNFFIERTGEYDPRGRLGGEDNALRADVGIRLMLKDTPHTVVKVDDFIIPKIIEELGILDGK
jgi:hypothetical protein